MAHILILGASRGIGLEFARQYLAAGHRVIATARDAAGLARLKALGAEPQRLDVADPASVSGLAWLLDGEKIDTAVYVAGVYAEGRATSPPTREAFDRVMHTNVLGAMQAIPQVAPLVEEAGGVFAFISSGMGQIGDVSSSDVWAYRVSKAALNMAVAAAQHDYPRATLLALCPGWVQTDMGGPGARLTVQDSVAAMRNTLAAATPADRGRFLHHDGRPYAGW
ncbi:Short-chain dehydrogenase [Rhodoferax sp. OV413]|uniref:SDR family oxidoreductase n=1 Tax=Rhodoferax sp. OV413 TaxID=1855285 RepID=UPI0008839BEE|nr:SDR family oxidoreductase [Rhodoferax sp. OV413]SDP27077.1 Short-chain dehydrogenase [Rhodoferax sp. OV413]